MAVRVARLKRLLGAVTAAGMVAFVAACGSGDSGATSSDGNVTLEFAQWWGAELPSGSFDKMISDFTAQNPNIKVKLLSAPYASTKQQLVTGAASKTLPDVVGLDGAWVSDFAKQGAITDLSKLMTGSPRRATRPYPARGPSSSTRLRRSARPAATSRAGRSRSTPPSPTASRTTSCRGSGRPAAACCRTASRT
jgi:hypothetical protein